MTDEKWVVVELFFDYSSVQEVHGIFGSEQDATRWAENNFYSKPFAIERVRKAKTEEEYWA